MERRSFLAGVLGFLGFGGVKAQEGPVSQPQLRGHQGKVVKVVEDWQFFDVSLDVGSGKDRSVVQVFEAGSGCGKSRWLIEKGSRVLKAGLRVLHICLEDSPVSVWERYRVFCGRSDMDKLNIMYYNDWLILKDRGELCGFDVVVFDYADLALGGRVEALRMLTQYARENNVSILTAAQKRHEPVAISDVYRNASF